MREMLRGWMRDLRTMPVETLMVAFAFTLCAVIVVLAGLSFAGVIDPSAATHCHDYVVNKSIYTQCS